MGVLVTLHVVSTSWEFCGENTHWNKTLCIYIYISVNFCQNTAKASHGEPLFFPSMSSSRKVSYCKNLQLQTQPWGVSLHLITTFSMGQVQYFGSRLHKIVDENLLRKVVSAGVVNVPHHSRHFIESWQPSWSQESQSCCTGDVLGIGQAIGTSPGKQCLLLVTHVQERSTQDKKEGKELFKIRPCWQENKLWWKVPLTAPSKWCARIVF